MKASILSFLISASIAGTSLGFILFQDDDNGEPHRIEQDQINENQPSLNDLGQARLLDDNQQLIFDSPLDEIHPGSSQFVGDQTTVSSLPSIDDMVRDYEKRLIVDKNDIPFIPVETLVSGYRDYMEGLERTIGTGNFLPVDFLAKANKIQSIVGRIVCKNTFQYTTWSGKTKTILRDQGWGTAFLVAPNILMTNQHVIPDSNFAENNVHIEFTFLDQSGNEKNVIYDLDPDAFFFTYKPGPNEEKEDSLDFTLVGIAPIENRADSPGDRWGYYDLSKSANAVVFKLMKVNIIQYPGEKDKQIVIQDNEMVDERDSDFIRYTTDTRGGSSGSPAFDNSWTLVALHHAAGEFKDGEYHNNEGIRITSIINYLEKEMDEGQLKKIGLR